MRRERGRHQPAQAGVLLAFHGEDGPATPAALLHFGQARHLGKDGEGRVEPLVAQDGRHVFEAGDAVTHVRPGQPVGGPGLLYGGDGIEALQADGLQ